jgi:chromosomal replication initiation ATPase DnaA
MLSALLLEKQLARRGLLLPADVASFIVQRIERSHIVLMRIVEILDEASLSHKRAMTVPFVRDVLRSRGLIDMGGHSHGEDSNDIAQTSSD